MIRHDKYFVSGTHVVRDTGRRRRMVCAKPAFDYEHHLVHEDFQRLVALRRFFSVKYDSHNEAHEVRVAPDSLCGALGCLGRAAPPMSTQHVCA